MLMESKKRLWKISGKALKAITYYIPLALRRVPRQERNTPASEPGTVNRMVCHTARQSVKAKSAMLLASAQNNERQCSLIRAFPVISHVLLSVRYKEKDTVSVRGSKFLKRKQTWRH